MKSKQNEELKQIVQGYLEENKEKTVSKVERVQATVVVDSVVWVLAKTEAGLHWIRADNQDNKDLFNYNTYLQQKNEFEQG